MDEITYRGVSLIPDFSRFVRRHRADYRAQISVFGRPFYLGRFDIAEDAARAYDAAAFNLQEWRTVKDYNFPQEWENVVPYSPEALPESIGPDAISRICQIRKQLIDGNHTLKQRGRKCTTHVHMFKRVRFAITVAILSRERAAVDVACNNLRRWFYSFCRFANPAEPKAAPILPDELPVTTYPVSLSAVRTKLPQVIRDAMDKARASRLVEDADEAVGLLRDWLLSRLPKPASA